MCYTVIRTDSDSANSNSYKWNQGYHTNLMAGIKRFNKQFPVPEDLDSESSYKSSFLSEIVQSEVALWTFVATALWTYLWQSRKRYFLFNLSVLLPFSLLVTLTLSWALLLVTSIGRLLFSRRDQDFDVDLFGSEVQPGEVQKWKSWEVLPASDEASLDEASPGPSAAPQQPRRRRLRAKRSSGEKAVKDSAGATGLPSKPTVAYFWQRRGSLERKLYGWCRGSSMRTHA